MKKQNNTAFKGFSKKTSEFFWELAFNNERPWFTEHKQEFEDYVNTPFKALARDTLSCMEQDYPQEEWLCHVARIYRDARRLHGNGPYKDHLWFSVKRGDMQDVLLEGPMFWFEVGAADYSFGLGFYSASAKEMELFRQKVDANPAKFKAIVDEIENCGEFSLMGEDYKRPKADRGELNPWYNKKYFGYEVHSEFDKGLYDPRLPQRLARAYGRLMPLYEFFIEIYKYYV